MTVYARPTVPVMVKGIATWPGGEVTVPMVAGSPTTPVTVWPLCNGVARSKVAVRPCCVLDVNDGVVNVPRNCGWVLPVGGLA